MTGTKLWEDADTAAFIALNKYTDDTPLSAGDRDRITSFNNHLVRATKLHNRLRVSEFNSRLGLAAVHSLSFGMAVVTEDGTVLMSNTVRTQIKALLAKTGTNRQAELVALLARIPVTG